MRSLLAFVTALVVGLRAAWIATATVAGAIWPVAALAAGGVAVTAGVGMLSIGPGYVEGIEVTCADAGTEIRATCGQQSVSCECSGAAYFSSEDVVSLTGRAETNFDANVRSVNCRSQSNVTCDCWALCASEPD
jgi:hypothetical protein